MHRGVQGGNMIFPSYISIMQLGYITLKIDISREYDCNLIVIMCLAFVMRNFEPCIIRNEHLSNGDTTSWPANQSDTKPLEGGVSIIGTHRYHNQPN